MDRAVAITGMGMVTAQGVGVEATWRGVVAGRDVLRIWSGSGAGHALTKMKVAECARELPRPEDLPGRLWRRLSRTQQLACVAVDEAIGQAGFSRRFGGERNTAEGGCATRNGEGDTAEGGCATGDCATVGRRVGLFLATTVCGMDVTERYYAQYRVNREAADLELLRRMQPYETGALLGRRHGIGAGGLRSVCLSTCVGSAMAIGTAMDAINLGECEVAIAGGSEALCRVVLSGFHSLKVVAAEGCRPFDKDRPGITVGEGAGMLVLESMEHARRRGAKVLAVLRGYGVSCDAHHVTAPEPEGKEAVRAMREAMGRAGMEVSEIDYINAHGTGTRDNDAMETKAIRGVFGEEQEARSQKSEDGEGIPLVSSTKRCTGHTFGAAGAVEAIFCVQAIREGVVPGNWGSVEGDPGLELPVARGGSVKREVRGAMSTNFAFGGNNTALVFSRDGETTETRNTKHETQNGETETRRHEDTKDHEEESPRRHRDAGDAQGRRRELATDRHRQTQTQKKRVGILGMGMVTDGYGDVGAVGWNLELVKW